MSTRPTSAELLRRIEELEDTTRRQAARLDEQERQLTSLRGAPPAARSGGGHHESDGRTAIDDGDRRAFFRRAGALAAGAVAAGSATALASATPAAAANGDPILIGAANTATGKTALSGTGSKPILHIKDTLSGVAEAAASFQASATGNAVFGAHITSTVANGAALVVGSTGSAGRSVAVDSPANGAHLVLNPQGSTAANRNLSPGCLAMDANEDLWLQVAAGPVWRKLAGPTSAGAFHLLSSPARIYDSRITPGIFNYITRSVDAKTKLGGGSTGVPAGATGVAVNLAVTQTNSGGYGALYSTVGWPGNASVNWSLANQTISNFTLTTVDSLRTFQCKIAGVAHVIIDLIGYYR